MTKPSIEYGARLLAFMQEKKGQDVDTLAIILTEQADRPVSSKKLHYLSMRESLCAKWLLQTLVAVAVKMGWEPADEFELDGLRQTIYSSSSSVMEGLENTLVADFLGLDKTDPLVKKVEGYIYGQ